jgi:hypothetical protein
MARLANLPTRVDVGFTPGSSTGPGTWQVTDKNAHAWPEVYFSGYGWVRFEPTPGGRTGERAPSYAPGGTTPGAVGTSPLPSTGPSAPTSNSKNNALNFRDRPGGRNFEPPATLVIGGKKLPLGLLITSLVLLMLALSPAIARSVLRRRRLGTRPPPARRSRSAAPADAGSAIPPGRPAAAALSAWEEVQDTSRDLGWAWSPARTPRDTAAWLAGLGLDGPASEAATRLAAAVGAARYGKAAQHSGGSSVGGSDLGSDTAVVAAVADGRLVVRGMLAASTVRARWRARLWPVSVLNPVASWFADGFDAVDRVGPWLRSFGRGGRSGAEA